MATITQRIELQGGADAQKQLLDLAQAGKLAFSTIEDAAKKGGDLVRAFQTGAAQRQINDLVSSAKGLAGTFSQVSQVAQGASKDLQTVGTSAQGAGRQVDSSNSKFSTTAKTMLAIAAGAVGLGAAIFSAAKSAAEGAKGIGDAADESGTSLEAFQKGKFILEQMNLSSKDAEKAISDLTDKVKENTATAVDALDKMGFRFANTEGGVNALKSAIGQLGTSNVVLAPLIQKLQQLGVAVAPGSDQAATIAKMAQAWGLAGSALQKVKDEDPDVVEILKQTADAIKGVGDEALQKQLAINAFGDDLGPKLVDKLKNGSEGIDAILTDFKALGLGASDVQVELGQNFANAMKRFSAAALQGRIEFGSNFLPIVTEGVKQFTNLLRLNRQPIQEWAESVKDSFKEIINDLFALFNGRRDLVKTGWLGSLADAISGVILPGLKGLSDLAQTAADKINAAFGTKLRISDIGLVAIIGILIGGFNLLALAAVTLFAGTSPLIDRFKQSLASIGISVDGIKNGFVTVFETLKSQLGRIDWKAIFGSIDATTVVETVLGITAAFLALRRGAALLAPLLSKIIGRQISADGVLFLGVLGQISGVTNSLVSVLAVIALGSTLFLNALKLAFGFLVPFIAILARGLAALAFANPFGAIILGLASIAVAAVVYWTEIKAAFSEGWAALKAGAEKAIEVLASLWASVKPTAVAAWDAIVQTASDLGQRIATAIASASAAIVEALVSPFRLAAGIISNIVDGILSLYNRITQSGSSSAHQLSSSFDESGFSQGFATGGPVRGPGTTTSDSIFARLSRDEYVQPAKRVYQYGLDFMEALRRGLVPVRAVRALMGDLRGFSMGGLVDGLTASLSMGVPGFAGGGLVLPQPAMARAGGRPVVLVMPDGNRFNLTASDPVAEAVIRYARSRNVASAGRAPSRVRG